MAEPRLKLMTVEIWYVSQPEDEKISLDVTFTVNRDVEKDIPEIKRIQQPILHAIGETFAGIINDVNARLPHDAASGATDVEYAEGHL